MYKDKCVAVVVPAHNEERFIGGVIATIPPYVDHIIVVDDCSTDNTSAAVAGCGDRRVELMRTTRNLGVGGATLAGYKLALEQRADVIVKMDGDGQMHPEDLPSLLDAVIEDGYDYAKGNRFLHPEALPHMPKLRLAGNIALTFLTKLASGYWHVFDPQNGFTAIKGETLGRLNPAQVHQGFFFENDMLVQLRLLDARVKDVAIPARYGEEISGLSPFRALFSFPLLLMHRFWRRVWHSYLLRDFSPIALFLLSGMPLLAWGTIFGAYTWAHSVLTNEFASTGTVMLSVLPFAIGFQLVLQAIVLDIQESPR